MDEETNELPTDMELDQFAAQEEHENWHGEILREPEED